MTTGEILATGAVAAAVMLLEHRLRVGPAKATKPKRRAIDDPTRVDPRPYVLACVAVIAIGVGLLLTTRNVQFAEPVEAEVGRHRRQIRDHGRALTEHDRRLDDLDRQSERDRRHARRITNLLAEWIVATDDGEVPMPAELARLGTESED